jgi:hypothetical protein
MSLKKGNNVYLIPQRTEQILHGLAIVLSEFPQVLNEHFIQPGMPIMAHNIQGPVF